MFKILKTMASLLAAAILLTSCGSSESNQKKPDNIETVSVWTGQAHSKELMAQMVDEYNNTAGKEKGIQIDYKVYGADYSKVVEMAKASNQMPDLFKASSVIANAKAGNLVAIDDMPGGKEFLKRYDGKLVEMQQTVDGKAYEVPFSLTTFGLVYNKDLFKKAGIVDENGEPTPPKTYEQMREYAKKLTNPKEKTYGIIFALKWEQVFDFELIYPGCKSIGAPQFDNVNGKFSYSLHEPVFDWLLQVKEDGSCFPGGEGLDNDQARAQFSEGRVGMKFAASYDVGVFNEQYVAKCDWGVAPIPTLSGEDKNKDYSMIGSLLHISPSVKDKPERMEKVMEVYKWFNSDEFLLKMYEEGKYVPYDMKIAEASNKKIDIKGWNEFVDISKYSFWAKPVPSVTLIGDSKYQTFQKIWAGTADAKEALLDLENRYNEALDTAIKDGKEKLENYIIPNYTIAK